jgi:tRNA pseudouridine32 synthase / 23S rRNA pseudouridine746 synthase
LSTLFAIVHLCDDFVLINKRPGVAFHIGRGHRSLTEEIRGALASRELYPLHRLDRITSGLLLFGRTRKAAAALAEQFRNHTVEKFYLAVGGASPKKKQGLIKGDMERGTGGTWFLTKALLRPAVTRFYSTSLRPGLRLYLLRPYTGRTHQIRVALKTISAAVIGDPLYCRKPKEGITADRGYLHAYALGFNLNGKRYRFVNAPDEGKYFTGPEFAAALTRLGMDPWALKWPNLTPPPRPGEER